MLKTKRAKSTKRGVLVSKKKMNKDDDDNYDNNNFPSSRTYKDIIEGRFDIVNVIYIDRKDDGYTIFGKAVEFSTKTIKKLKKDGFDKASNELKKIYN